MPKQPFTPQGVADKQAELYALSDAQLLVAAKEVCDEFRTWLNNNFELDSEQQAYVAEMPEQANFAFGAGLAAIIIGRGQITMGDSPDDSRRDHECYLYAFQQAADHQLQQW